MHLSRTCWAKTSVLGLALIWSLVNPGFAGVLIPLSDELTPDPKAGYRFAEDVKEGLNACVEELFKKQVKKIVQAAKAAQTPGVSPADDQKSELENRLLSLELFNINKKRSRLVLFQHQIHRVMNLSNLGGIDMGTASTSYTTSPAVEYALMELDDQEFQSLLKGDLLNPEFSDSKIQRERSSSRLSSNFQLADTPEEALEKVVVLLDRWKMKGRTMVDGEPLDVVLQGDVTLREILSTAPLSNHNEAQQRFVYCELDQRADKTVVEEVQRIGSWISKGTYDATPALRSLNFTDRPHNVRVNQEEVLRYPEAVYKFVWEFRRQNQLGWPTFQIVNDALQTHIFPGGHTSTSQVGDVLADVSCATHCPGAKNTLLNRMLSEVHGYLNLAFTPITNRQTVSHDWSVDHSKSVDDDESPD